MACKCSPSLKRLMADFAARGHVNSGCCGDQAHQARKSDHNADASGYAHAQDVHEKANHDMQPWIDFVMRHPELFPQVKYLIYEGFIYYPHDGARKAGRYTYTGPNAHASHAHVSIFSWATHYAGSWFVTEAYDGGVLDPITELEDIPVPVVIAHTGNRQNFLVMEDSVTWLNMPAPRIEAVKKHYGFYELDHDEFQHLLEPINAKREALGLKAEVVPAT